MTFTDDEKMKLLENGERIADWLESNCKPLRNREEIPFGDIVTRGRFDEIRKNEFSLIVSSDTAEVGGFSHDLLRAYTDPKTDDYGKYELLFALCRDWHKIKGEVQKAILKDSVINSTINNFTV